jgi:hypothetical protein
MTGHNFPDLEIATNQLQDATAFAYNENCPLTVRENRNTSWWNQDLTLKKKKVRRLM